MHFTLVQEEDGKPLEYIFDTSYIFYWLHLLTRGHSFIFSHAADCVSYFGHAILSVLQKKAQLMIATLRFLVHRAGYIDSHCNISAMKAGTFGYHTSSKILGNRKFDPDENHMMKLYQEMPGNIL